MCIYKVLYTYISFTYIYILYPLQIDRWVCIYIYPIVSIPLENPNIGSK